MANTKDLSIETAEVLLAQIKEAADGVLTAGHLRDLAEAYSTVEVARPKRTGGGSVTSY